MNYFNIVQNDGCGCDVPAFQLKLSSQFSFSNKYIFSYVLALLSTTGSADHGILILVRWNGIGEKSLIKSD